jgi:DNA-binding HxlR family transcriptional regulator
MQENICRSNSQESELRQGLELVTDKWTALVMNALKGGTRRLSDLQREIEGVSQKMLIQTLRRMEEDGLVARTVYPVVPPRVEYTLTPLGETFLKPLANLCQWAIEHMPEVQEARQWYRTRATVESLQKQV